MSFRELKAIARTAVHQTMKVSALWYANGLSTSTPVPVSIRVSYKMDLTGEDQGTRLHWAQSQEKTPEIIFWLEEAAPVRLGVITISPTEGYRLDNIKPIDLQTQTAQATPLLAGDLSSFDYPGSLVWPMNLWLS
jgi:hypothetical protein